MMGQTQVHYQRQTVRQHPENQTVFGISPKAREYFAWDEYRRVNQALTYQRARMRDAVKRQATAFALWMRWVDRMAAVAGTNDPIAMTEASMQARHWQTEHAAQEQRYTDALNEYHRQVAAYGLALELLTSEQLDDIWLDTDDAEQEGDE
jgi:hypothetical protein